MEAIDKLERDIRELGIDPLMKGGCLMLAETLQQYIGHPLEKRLTGVICKAIPVVCKIAGVSFYETEMWRALRYRAFAKHGNRCQCCGARPSDGAVLQVDHIKPRSKYPELMLEIDNLQVLCKECNLGKSNRDETDWR